MVCRVYKANLFTNNAGKRWPNGGTVQRALRYTTNDQIDEVDVRVDQS